MPLALYAILSRPCGTTWTAGSNLLLLYHYLKRLVKHAYLPVYDCNRFVTLCICSITNGFQFFFCSWQLFYCFGSGALRQWYIFFPFWFVVLEFLCACVWKIHLTFKFFLVFLRLLYYRHFEFFVVKNLIIAYCKMNLYYNHLLSFPK